MLCGVSLSNCFEGTPPSSPPPSHTPRGPSSAKTSSALGVLDVHRMSGGRSPNTNHVRRVHAAGVPSCPPRAETFQVPRWHSIRKSIGRTGGKKRKSGSGPARVRCGQMHVVRGAAFPAALKALTLENSVLQPTSFLEPSASLCSQPLPARTGENRRKPTAPPDAAPRPPPS